jgi:hypothetical protein
MSIARRAFAVIANPENSIKGRIAEARVEELLRTCGNKVYRFGCESIPKPKPHPAPYGPKRLVAAITVFYSKEIFLRAGDHCCWLLAEAGRSGGNSGSGT